MRVAVTGLRRCGKTVFTTSVIHNLMSAGQWPDLLPFLKVASRGDLIAAEVFPLPGLPTFPFETSLAAITGGGARRGEHDWPAPTDRLCGLRIAVRYRSRRALALLSGSRVRTLNIDLIDYPGEWLLDLPLLTKGLRDLVGGDAGAHRQRAARKPVSGVAGVRHGHRRRGFGRPPRSEARSDAVR